MMSHMAIGTGAGDGGEPFSASTKDRMLEQENCVRVQVMKDTSLQSDYAPFNVTFASGDNSLSQPFDAWSSAEANKIRVVNTATNVDLIRVGMPVEGPSDVMPSADVTVTAIEVSLGVSTVTLSHELQGFDPSAGTQLTFEYDGVVSSISNHPIAAPGGTLSGTADYGNIRGKVGAYYNPNDKLEPPFLGDPGDAPSGYEQYGTAVDGCYQGKLAGSSIVKDSGTSPEGYPTNENDYGVIENPVDTTDPANAGLAATARPGTKKSGTRVVYVATFKENNPTGIATAAITEAGIFNRMAKDAADSEFDETRGEGTLVTDENGGSIYIEKGGFTGKAITQTMLCRTTFDVVNKASQDTLQITWSVQLSDQSA
jgi:hypothetical protein